jgi:hypothetical protein
LGSVKTINYRLTIAYSKNYGHTAPLYPESKNQLSWQIETSTLLRPLRNTEIHLGVSGDRGSMYGNNMTIMLGVSKSGILNY